MRGGGRNAIEDWFENTFDPNKNGLAEAFSANGPIARAFDPQKNGVADSFREFGANTKEAFEDIGRRIENTFSKEAFEKAFAPLTDYFGKIANDPVELVILLLTIAEFHPGFKAATDAALIASEIAQGKTPSTEDMINLGLSLSTTTIPGLTSTSAQGALKNKIASSIDDKLSNQVVNVYKSRLNATLPVVGSVGLGTPGQTAGALVATAANTGIKSAAPTDMRRRKAIAFLALLVEAKDFFQGKQLTQILNSFGPPSESQFAREQRMEAERKEGGIPYIKKHDWLKPDVLKGINRNSEAHLSAAAQWYAKVFDVTPEESIDALTSKGIVIRPEYEADLFDGRNKVTPEQLLSGAFRSLDPRRSDGTSLFEPPGPDWVRQNLIVVNLLGDRGVALPNDFLRVPGWTGRNPPRILNIPRAYSEVVGIEEQRLEHMEANLEAVKEARKILAERETKSREAMKAAQEAQVAKNQEQAQKEAEWNARLAKFNAEQAAKKEAEDKQNEVTQKQLLKTKVKADPSSYLKAIHGVDGDNIPDFLNYRNTPAGVDPDFLRRRGVWDVLVREVLQDNQDFLVAEQDKARASEAAKRKALEEADTKRREVSQAEIRALKTANYEAAEKAYQAEYDGVEAQMKEAWEQVGSQLVPVINEETQEVEWSMDPEAKQIMLNTLEQKTQNQRIKNEIMEKNPIWFPAQQGMGRRIRKMKSRR